MRIQRAKTRLVAKTALEVVGIVFFVSVFAVIEFLCLRIAEQLR